MRSFPILCLCILLYSSLSLAAEPGALPPPTVETSDNADATAGLAEQSAPNLHDELKTPDDNSNVDVRSYQRKDGAIVTEYSLNGQIYEIKVQPIGGLPAYYLYLNKAGNFKRRRPGGQPFVTPPSWILKEF